MAVKKGGQIGIVLILAVIIIFFGSLFLILYRSDEVIIPEKAGAVPIRLLVSSCLEQTAQNGAHLIGRQGGFVFLDNNAFEMDRVRLSLFARKKSIFAPSIDELEKDLTSFIDSGLPLCFLREKDHVGGEVLFSKSQSNVQILPSKVVIITDFPVEVVLGGRRERENQFSLELPVRLGLLHDVATQVVQDLESHPGFLDASWLSTLPVAVEVRVFNETYMVFTLVDESSVTRIESPYRFHIALDSPPNHPPYFSIMDNFKLKIHVPFTLKIDGGDPDGDAVTFSAVSTLFSITSNGRIEFTPVREGSFSSTIRAMDSKGSFTEKEVMFEVLP